MPETEKMTVTLTQGFANPILRFQIPNAEALNRLLLQEAAAMRAEAPAMVRNKGRTGWHSQKDLMQRREPGLSQLAGIIPSCIQSASRAIAPEFDPAAFRLVTEGWININPPQGYNAPHRHSGFIWSGCYYVNLPAADEGPSGCIEFLSPVLVPGEFRLLGAACYQDRITMRPKAGDMLLFPSYLTHWVYPNDTEEDRLTIAFNGTYLPK